MTSWWTFSGLYSEEDEKDDITFSGESSTTPYYGRKYRSSLGWSKNKLTDTTSYYSKYWGSGSSYSYSSSSFGDKDSREKLLLLTRAYKAVRDMIVILDFPFDVVIKLANYSEYGSGGAIGKSKNTRTLGVPSSVIDYSEYDTDDKINILCGLGTHEAAHLKYTEYRVYNKYAQSATYVERFLTNLIEDVRIEDKLLSERPGYFDLINASNEFRYKRLEERLSYCTIPEEEKEFMSEIIKFIRYPDKINLDIIKTYERQFKEIKSVLSEDHIFTKDSCILGTKLCDRLKLIFSELKYNFESFEVLISELWPSDEYEAVIGMDGGTELLEKSEVSNLLRSGDSKLYSELISGVLEFGEGLNTFFEKPSGNNIKYLQIKEQIAKYVPGIKKLIIGTDKNYDFTIHGCREGALDTNKLAEAYQGVPQVYIKKGKVSTNKTTVCVLIDQSGSMSGQKEYIARQAAVLLNESLKDLPGVDLYIYGHSADMKASGDTLIYTYREGTKYCPGYALSEAVAHRNNRDGVAIYETAKRVRKHTQEDCIMFVLSDGSPAAHGYGGWKAIEDTKSKVKEVEKLGFTVIQVSIDSIRYAKEMFSNVISLEYDLSSFPKKLSQVIKKAIVKNKQTTAS